ncbi:MAG TPA: flagellar assembly protein FliW [Pyrinomonadaceae bacterium]|nr:flagellar assembly protein FliW [Pyrinomonadaceae bacterium]
MATICIQGTELNYDDNDVIVFPEGLIGLPHLKRMVLIRQSFIEPFMWLASLDQDDVAFVVIETKSLFAGFAPSVPADSNFANTLSDDETPLVLSIVLINSEWRDCTVNLRAPIFISSRMMSGAQVILTDNTYSVSEPLPLAMAA